MTAVVLYFAIPNVGPHGSARRRSTAEDRTRNAAAVLFADTVSATADREAMDQG
jgi:hypothetical protein